MTDQTERVQQTQPTYPPVVGVHIVVDSTSASDLLARSVAGVYEVDAASITVRHECPECGSAEHGRPIVVGVEPAPYASISRTGETEAVAFTTAGPIGIDIESITRIGAAPVRDALLHKSERKAIDKLDPSRHERRTAILWSAKEAILKASGKGLNVDPRHLALKVDDDDASAVSIELVEWTAELGLHEALSIYSFVVDADIVGAVAVMAGEAVLA
jgi:4'-phosphopantetheinyl transferase